MYIHNYDALLYVLINKHAQHNNQRKVGKELSRNVLLSSLDSCEVLVVSVIPSDRSLGFLAATEGQEKRVRELSLQTPSDRRKPEKVHHFILGIIDN